MRDERVVLDHRVLRLWLNRAVYRGAAMVRGSYRSHCSDEGGITVETSAGPLRARLLIDCMGPRSPIVAAYRPIRHLK